MAGTVLVLFATMLTDVVPQAAGHLLVASIITVPASTVIARVMIPQTQAPTPGRLELPIEVSGPIDALSERTRVLTTYALCGFANFGSVGILIAGLATMAPERRGEIAQLGLRSLMGGTLATCMTAAMVGCLT